MAGYSGVEFDHGAFYEWAERQSEPVIISEYAMPEERFERIDFIEKRSLLSATNKRQVKKEGLWVPRTQEKFIAETKRRMNPQGELFG